MRVALTVGRATFTHKQDRIFLGRGMESHFLFACCHVSCRETLSRPQLVHRHLEFRAQQGGCSNPQSIKTVVEHENTCEKSSSDLLRLEDSVESSRDDRRDEDKQSGR